MKPESFFAEPPKAERAFLAAYQANEMRGLYGIRIELEPLLIAGQEDPELQSEVHLDHLALPSIAPSELQNTRFAPDLMQPPPNRYEGSCYFLGQHNWVDLKEIRFLGATGDTIVAEYDLVIDLPVTAPSEYPLVLAVPTTIEPPPSAFVPKPPRHVPLIGTFTETHQDFWECATTFHKWPVTIQLHAEPDSFEKVTAFARGVIVGNAITPTDIQKQIEERIGDLQWKLDYFKVCARFSPDELVPNWFSFYQERDPDELRLAICFCDPMESGQWFLRFCGTTACDLEWIPK